MVYDRITAKNVGFDLAQEAKNLSKALKEDPSNQREHIEIAARQIRTHESETLEDNVVSFYPYFVYEFKGKTKLFSAPVLNERFLAETAIDPLERNGKALDGFRLLQEKIGEVKGPKFFLWISPRGSAGTEGIYKDINYRYHQIYIGEVNGSKTKAYALKSDVEESVLADWVNSMSCGQISIEGKKAEEFLLNPLVLPSFSREHVVEMALFRLKRLLEKRGQKNFYKDIDIDNVPDLVRKKSLEQENDTLKIAWELERSLSSLSSDKYLGFKEARRAIGGQLYVLYDRYADEKGEVKLTGCAGGSVSLKSLFDNSVELPTVENIFSTDFRLKSVLDAKKDPNLCRCGGMEPHFHCPGSKEGKKCSHPIIVGQGATSCPSCGTSKTC